MNYAINNFLKRQNLFSRILKYLNTCLRGVVGYHLTILRYGIGLLTAEVFCVLLSRVEFGNLSVPEVPLNG